MDQGIRQCRQSMPEPPTKSSECYSGILLKQAHYFMMILIIIAIKFVHQIGNGNLLINISLVLVGTVRSIRIRLKMLLIISF